MRFVNVREFKLRATQLLKSKDEVIITRYGKPVARLIPVTDQSANELLAEMGDLFRDAGVTKNEALEALEDVRRERRPTLQRARRRAAA